MERDSLWVDTLDIRRKDVCLALGRPGSEENVVGVPVDREHGRAERLLDVLRHPPVVFLVKVADGDGPGRISMKPTWDDRLQPDARLLLFVDNKEVQVLARIGIHDAPGSRTHSKLVLLGTPLDTGSSPVDAQQHQRRLPPFGGLGPNIGVTVLRAGHDTVGLRRPRDGCDQLVVLDNQPQP